MKSYPDSYLYQTIPEYGKKLATFIVEADRIEKNSASFNDVAFEIKNRQISPVIMKVLFSNKVELLIGNDSMSRPFKVFYAKDIKKDQDKKVFIDCTGLIILKNGEYKCLKPKTFISYIITAMMYIIYDKLPNTILSNASILDSSTNAFVDLMIYILGYLKVPVSYMDNKEKMSFVIAEYYLWCVLGKEDKDSNFNLGKKISKIKESKTCDYLYAKFADTYAEGKGNINEFLAKFAEEFLGQTDEVNSKSKKLLTVDTFVQKWMYTFGPGTIFGTELFVPFGTMLTDCYVGDYINNQNTIEKVANGSSKTAVKEFSTEILKIGMENA